jgi:hypothetical protein
MCLSIALAVSIFSPAPMKPIKRILIYKRTHRGDPDALGIFGINDCMRSVRDFEYGAVIGVGGIGAEPRTHGIAEKISWIGIGPHKMRVDGRTLVTFDHFVFYDTTGPRFLREAPALARRIYRDNIRILIHDLTPKQRREAMAILARASSAPPSPGRVKHGVAIRKPCLRKAQSSKDALPQTRCGCHREFQPRRRG